MIIALFKLISPFHSSEAAWYDAKAQGLPPYLSAKFIGSICLLGAAGMAVFGYTLAPDQIKIISDNLYNIINGIAALYGVAMVISHQFFKKKASEVNVKVSASQQTVVPDVKESAKSQIVPDKVEPNRIVILPVPKIGKDNPPQPPPPPQTSGDDESTQPKGGIDKVTEAND